MTRAAQEIGCSYDTLVRRTSFHSRKGRSAKRRLDALTKAVLRVNNEIGAPEKTKKFLVYDIESKDVVTQKAGFTRPFACGVIVPDAGSNA